MKRPSKRNFKSFYDWILGIKPLSREETDFVKHGEDFVALADAEEGGWFDGVVEDCLSCLPGGLAKVNLHAPCSTQAVGLFPFRKSYTGCRSSSQVPNS